MGARGSASPIDWTGLGDGLERERFDALQSFMLVAVVAHCGTFLGRDDVLSWWAKSFFMPPLALSALVGLGWRHAKPYCVMASLAVMSVWLVMLWPTFANHTLLEWSILLFLVLCLGDAELGLKALRWLVAIVLFHTGSQKLVMGHFFEGEFLAWAIAVEANFREFFGLVLSDAEIARLVAMGGRLGTGPYTTTDPMLLVISNAVWIGEMGLAILLLVPKLRKLALWGALALLLGIELGAREVIFGCLFSFLLLMFYEGRKAYALWPVLAGLQLLAMLSLYLLPGLRLN